MGAHSGERARAWDEGWTARAEYDERRDVPTNWPDLNPYRAQQTGESECLHTNVRTFRSICPACPFCTREAQAECSDPACHIPPASTRPEADR